LARTTNANFVFFSFLPALLFCKTKTKKKIVKKGTFTAVFFYLKKKSFFLFKSFSERQLKVLCEKENTKFICLEKIPGPSDGLKKRKKSFKK
jgi:hypothetical protein